MSNLYKFAKKLELKIKIAQNAPPTIEQSGTTELFFDNENNQRKFNQAIQNVNGPVYKALLDHFTKAKVSCSFELTATANAKQNATWNLTVEPIAIKNTIYKTLDTEYRKIMNTSMVDRQKLADTKAKSGSGSGTLQIGSLALDA